MIKKYHEDTVEVKLYLGSRIGYHGKEFSEDELVEFVGEFQGKCDDYSPVRVTKTRYVDKHYNESGWELTAVNYPPSPKTRKQLTAFMTSLAESLLEHFSQRRMTLVSKKKTTVLERQT